MRCDLKSFFEIDIINSDMTNLDEAKGAKRHMMLERSRFDSGEIERLGMGAGIIPVSVDPDGVLQILLGRERYVNQWKGSCRWSGFEGSRKEGEKLIDAAVREFREESMDIIVNERDLVQALEHEDYYIRIVLKVSSERKPERYHVTYVVFVEWDAELPSKFQMTRSHAEYVERLCQEWKHIRPSFLGEPGDEVGPIHERGDGSFVVLKNVHNSPCILQSPWCYDDNKKFIRAEICDDRCQKLLHWKNVRDRLGRAFTKHRCIQFQHDNTWGLVQDVHISKDFLEKDQVRWWTIPQLDQVMANRGQFGAERFRPFFLPVLQTLLSELHSSPPSDIRAIVLAETITHEPHKNDQGSSKHKEDGHDPNTFEYATDETGLLCAQCEDWP